MLGGPGDLHLADGFTTHGQRSLDQVRFILDRSPLPRIGLTSSPTKAKPTSSAS
ncbi:MAG: hypothetical protein MZV64_60230 [Ignavibacteriales bacterium]|nr:hypothetical protein [Ignavibacteriales bacterium]